MDPRKAAKVSSPDLLKAFREGTGGAGEAPPDSSPLRVWVALSSPGEGVAEVVDYVLGDLEDALDALREHLQKGDGYAGAMFVSAEMPFTVSQLEQ